MNSTSWAKIFRAICCPEIAIRQLIRTFSIGSLDFRLAIDALDRPQYAFGVKQAIYLATKLKLPKVSVIEFGVAAGEGLLVLERYAQEMGKRAGIEVEVYGFDTGFGLPAVLDYKDLGYVWKRGAYQMDVDGLKSKLKSAHLVLGDVRDTMSDFLKSDHAPIGFISFDLDLYSSTKSAFQVFEGNDDAFLPRVVCYFDDVASDGHQISCDRVGELLAIQEFNKDASSDQTLAPFGIFNAKHMFPAFWTQQLWVYHRFQHADYNTYIGADANAR